MFSAAHLSIFPSIVGIVGCVIVDLLIRKAGGYLNFLSISFREVVREGSECGMCKHMLAKLLFQWMTAVAEPSLKSCLLTSYLRCDSSLSSSSTEWPLSPAGPPPPHPYYVNLFPECLGNGFNQQQHSGSTHEPLLPLPAITCLSLVDPLWPAGLLMALFTSGEEAACCSHKMTLTVSTWGGWCDSVIHAFFPASDVI